MSFVTFMPGNRTVEAPEGSMLLDAAKKAGIHADTPCGGRGLCRKCTVQVVAGKADYENNGALGDALVKEGYILLCRAKVTDEPLTVRIISDVSAETGNFTKTVFIDPSKLPMGESTPIVKKAGLSVGAPSAGDGLSDCDRLSKAASGLGSAIDIPLSVLKTLPEALRADDGNITAYYYADNSTAHIVDITAGEDDMDYGIAVDIGTTTVAVSLMHMPDGRIIAAHTAYNGQISCGLDVISRINYAKNAERLEELRQKVLATINGITQKLAGDTGVGKRSIRNASIAGNTVMTHLFLGIKPEYIRLDPYTPAVYVPQMYKAGEIGLDIHPETPVYIAPCVGSYVGGDITSGLLCTPLADSEEVSLFIDIGTNGEMVLGNSDFLIGCACSAGPAFEGGGIDKGMRASTGAIERVSVDAETGMPDYAVIGGTEAAGICGSGLISLIAGLFATGWIDPAGKLNRGKPCENIRVEGKSARYVIAPGLTPSDEVYISEADIDNLIRAKGAIFSACRVLMHKVGLETGDISKVYIAGGFGQYLDMEDAKTIGLIPDLPPDRYEFIGNTSWGGASLTLLSEKHREKELEIAKKITYLDLGAEPEYMHEYTAALFIPHTDEKLFGKR